MSEANKDIINRLWDVWHSKEFEKLSDLIAENHVNRDPNNPTDLIGVQGYCELIAMYTTLLPDLQFDIQEMIADGDVVCTRWIARGTHTGEALGLVPTNASVARTGMSWQRLQNGKIVETWVERDGLGLAKDIGMVPPD